MAILNNRTGKATIKLTATANVALSALAAANETVTKAKINAVYWSGTWTVARGANTVLNLTGSDHWLLSDEGVVLDEYPGVDFAFTLTGNGSIVVIVNKND